MVACLAGILFMRYSISDRYFRLASTEASPSFATQTDLPPSVYICGIITAFDTSNHYSITVLGHFWILVLPSPNHVDMVLSRCCSSSFSAANSSVKPGVSRARRKKSTRNACVSSSCCRSGPSSARLMSCSLLMPVPRSENGLVSSSQSSSSLSASASSAAALASIARLPAALDSSTMRTFRIFNVAGTTVYSSGSRRSVSDYSRI
ncbi:hypothetical protein EJ04DRAFT_195069 [Polyplosphaeria fusca]|uniref:Uncharacterized protein n=1 Tax=Polyplosphaeria fusca TaxID=682080 RepID=A0A9P4R2V2_9PLEO|nr:hypothetical protein EJ04DRAFT_195069 [Polyplosphaeria fusca]